MLLRATEIRMVENRFLLIPVSRAAAANTRKFWGKPDEILGNLETFLLKTKQHGLGEMERAVFEGTLEGVERRAKSSSLEHRVHLFFLSFLDVKKVVYLNN